MSEITEQQWTEAKAHLDECRIAFTEIGVSGFMGLTVILNPLLMRYEKGERTQVLYDEIMECEL